MFTCSCWLFNHRKSAQHNKKSLVNERFYINWHGYMYINLNYILEANSSFFKNQINVKRLINDMDRHIVPFNHTLGCLRKTPTSDSLVKSHDNVCSAKKRGLSKIRYFKFGWFRHTSKTTDSDVYKVGWLNPRGDRPKS